MGLARHSLSPEMTAFGVQPWKSLWISSLLEGEVFDTSGGARRRGCVRTRRRIHQEQGLLVYMRMPLLSTGVDT